MFLQKINDIEKHKWLYRGKVSLYIVFTFIFFALDGMVTISTWLVGITSITGMIDNGFSWKLTGILIGSIVIFLTLGNLTTKLFNWSFKYTSKIFLKRRNFHSWIDYYYGGLLQTKTTVVQLPTITYYNKSDEIKAWKKKNCWWWEMQSRSNCYYFWDKKKAILFKLTFGGQT